jgi:hypothetical protein
MNLQVVFDSFPEDLVLQQLEGNIMVASTCKVSAYNTDLSAAGDTQSSDGTCVVSSMS